MPLPQIVQNAVDDALKFVEKHPLHEYHPEKRRELFEALMSLEISGARTRAWLTIQTCKRLLPIYQTAITPTEYLRAKDIEDYKALGQESLRIAELIMLREYDPIAGYELHITKNYHMMDNVHRSFPVVLASTISASDKALCDAYYYHAYDPEWKEHDFYWNINLYKTQLNGDYVRITGEELTNHQWAISGGADSCTNALLAVAFDTQNKRINPKQSLEFWQWWLTDAIQEAWEITKNET